MNGGLRLLDVFCCCSKFLRHIIQARRTVFTANTAEIRTDATGDALHDADDLLQFTGDLFQFYVQILLHPCHPLQSGRNAALNRFKVRSGIFQIDNALTYFRVALL